MLFPKLSVYLSIWGFCENGCWSLNLSMCMYSLVFDVWFYCIVWYDAWFYNTMFDAWFYYIVRWMLIVMLILSLSLVHILTTQVSQSQALVHKTITLPWIPHVLKVDGCDSIRLVLIKFYNNNNIPRKMDMRLGNCYVTKCWTMATDIFDVANMQTNVWLVLKTTISKR